MIVRAVVAERVGKWGKTVVGLAPAYRTRSSGGLATPLEPAVSRSMTLFIDSPFERAKIMIR